MTDRQLRQSVSQSTALTSSWIDNSALYTIRLSITVCFLQSAFRRQTAFKLFASFSSWNYRALLWCNYM